MKTFGIVGWKNSGKTGLVVRLVTAISEKGFSVSTIKHAHHRFDVDQPGKDSFRHRDAGAKEIILSSKNRWVLMNELRDDAEPNLSQLVSRLSPVDLVLVEGFKNDVNLKLEAHRLETGQPLLAQSFHDILAVASNSADLNLNVPVFDLNDTAAIADFVLRRVGLSER